MLAQLDNGVTGRGSAEDEGVVDADDNGFWLAEGGNETVVPDIWMCPLSPDSDGYKEQGDDKRC